MKTSRPRALVLLACTLALSAAVAQEAPPQPLPVGAATIDKVKGDVAVILPGATPASAQRGAVLPPGTIVDTHRGSVVLRLEDGSEVLVQSKSSVVLKSPPESEGHFFDLILGKIVAKVKKRLSESPSFRMGTPTAVITVRGTRFEVNFSKKGVTKVEVFEGLVEVAGVGVQGPPVLLQPGFGTEVLPQRLPEPPRRMSELWEPGDRVGDRERGAPGMENATPGTQQPGERQTPSQPENENESEPH